MNSHQKEELWDKIAKIIRDAITDTKLVKDSSSLVQPTLTEDDIRICFHDDFAWYGDQIIVVVPRIIKSDTSSDGFFATSSEHYIGFPWL